MGLFDLITGDENGKAAQALKDAMGYVEGVSTPTANDLQLSPLQQYYQTGELTPELAAAAEAGPSEFSKENLSSVPFETMQKVLAQEQQIADDRGMTPQERAAIAEVESNMGRQVAGQRGAIAQDFAQRGVPASLISAALQNGAMGDDAQNAFLAETQAEGQAATNAQNALANEGALAGTMQGQQASQANAVAAAQDALNQFNANNRQQTNLVNQGARSAADLYNTTTKQNIAGQNVSGENARQFNNQVTAKEDAARLALEKANAIAGIGEASAGQHMATGQQEAGLFGGLVGAGATLGAGYMMKPGAPAAASAGAPVMLAADGGEVPPMIPPVNFVDGGRVPGSPMVSGDDRRNDVVPARLSPGEFVVPRTAMARPEVRNFLAREVPTPRPPAGAHPSDVASILKALQMLRGGAEA